MVTNTVTASDETAKNSTETTSNDVRELLRVFGQATTSIVLLTAALKKQASRSDAIEKRLAALDGADEPAPITEKRPIGEVPRLALRHDAAILLEVTSDLGEANLEGREVTMFVTLSEAEGCDVIDRMDAGFSEVAARAAWQVLRTKV